MDDPLPRSTSSDRVIRVAFISGVASALITIALVGFMLTYNVPASAGGSLIAQSYPLRGEALKLLLQFFLITSTGGLLLFVLAYFRDQRAAKDKLERDNALLAKQDEKEKSERRDSQIGELQKIDGELSRVYRMLKTAKRRLRYQALECSRDKEGKLQRPFVFEKNDFEQTMGELLSAQINIECLRDDLRTRIDLIEKERLQLIRRRLHYAARFYHDVLEDFERGRVVRVSGQYVAGSNCENIFNFLSSQKLPTLMPPAISDCLAKYSERVDKKGSTTAEQHILMDEIETLRRRNDLAYDYRFRAIADDCFALASAEIRDRIRELQSGSSATSNPAVTHRSVMVDGSPIND